MSQNIFFWSESFFCEMSQKILILYKLVTCHKKYFWSELFFCEMSQKNSKTVKTSDMSQIIFLEEFISL